MDASRSYLTQTLPTCLILAGICCAAASASPLAWNADKPNILFIYADDLGYGDVSIYNQDSQIPTPNIDRFAKQGLRFTDAHSPHATCTGSRYGLLTGTSSARSGIKNTVLRYGPGIDPDEMTIADFLREQGYATKMVGKWHLGLVRSGKAPSDRFLGTPEDSGFDYSFVAEGSSDLNEIRARNRVLCDETVRIITEYGPSKQDKRLFLYYAPHEPHNPAVPEEPFVGRSKAGTYGDYVAQLDHWVGRVLKALKDANLADNTLVIFASDNGAQTKFTADYPAHSPNGIFSGGKAHSEEGGHRTPFIARWPGVVPASTVSNALINQTDFFATLADLFNVDLAERYPGSAKDSYSFLPVLKNPSARHDRPPMVVVGSYRKGNWKIIVDGQWWTARSGEELKLKSLFHLDNDPAEAKNLLNEHPEVGQQLFSEYKHFINTRELKPHATASAQKGKKRKKK